MSIKGLPQAGGKNASLGEMIGNCLSLGIKVLDGFATGVEAFHEFRPFNCLLPRTQCASDRLDRCTLVKLSEGPDIELSNLWKFSNVKSLSSWATYLIAFSADQQISPMSSGELQIVF